MKILLAVSEKNDPRAVSAYLARRFGRHDVELDVLTVLPASAEAEDAGYAQGDALASSQVLGTHHQKASFLVNVFAAELQARVDSARMRTHVEYGDPADVILACSKRWHSELVLIEAPHRKGLLTAFRLDGVTRRLFAQATCPVELLRTNHSMPTAGCSVLIPVGLAQLDNFPFAQLQGLPWAKGSCIHLLGVVPAPYDESRFEANAAAVVRAMHVCSLYKQRAEERLAKVAKDLTELLGRDITVKHEVVDGSPRDVIEETAAKMQPALIVLADTDGSARRMPAPASPVTIAMSNHVPVLLLRTPQACAPGTVKQPASGYRQLSSH